MQATAPFMSGFILYILSLGGAALALKRFKQYLLHPNLLFASLFVLVFIYLVPSFSHLISFPLYLIEPMRLMLILALVHTSKKNAYLLALTMPVFSFMISAHPEVPKMMLITFELIVNVFLFYFLTKLMKHIFLSILLSIMISKAVYYLIKFGLIELMVINTGLISTPVVIQLIMTLLFSLYVYRFYRRSL
jgi:hypothetical protein